MKYIILLSILALTSCSSFEFKPATCPVDHLGVTTTTPAEGNQGRVN